MSGQAVNVNEPAVSRAADAVVREALKTPGVEGLRPTVRVVEPVLRAAPVPETERSAVDKTTLATIEVPQNATIPDAKGLIAVHVHASEPKPDPVVMRVDGTSSFLTLQEHIRRRWKDAARCDLSGMDLRGYSFVGANLKGAKLDEANFSGCDLQKAVLTDASAKSCDFEAADFSGATLRQTDLENSNLTRARFCTNTDDPFVAAVVAHVNFAGCKLSRAVFIPERAKGSAGARRCEVHNSDFSHCDMSHCNLQGMAFCSCRFTETSLIGASLQRCNFEGVDLSSTNLINANLSQAAYSDSSKFPDGYVVPADAKNADVVRRAAKEADEKAGHLIKMLVIVLACVFCFIIIIAILVSRLSPLERTPQSQGGSPVADNAVSSSPGISPRDATKPQAIEKTSASRKLITNSIGMRFTLIPAGEFMMGSPADETDRFRTEDPQHRVQITKPFHMGVTEVTQGQWFAVMATKPWSGKDNVAEGKDYPAVYVSWHDAVDYCEKLSIVEATPYRLPTEAEWEYACRGGTATAYNFGSSSASLTDYAWFEENALGIGRRHAQLVARKKANAFGLYDTHGNVWEWCSDRLHFDDYAASPATDPQGDSSGSAQVYRGGSWFSEAELCRSAVRYVNVPSSMNFYLGFRLAMSLSAE